MFSWLTNRQASRRAVDLYGAVVALARSPLFYNKMGVADIPEGRYEILILHLFLVMEKLRSVGGDAALLSQDLIDQFVVDMDDNMREMGVGDLTVPRKVKKATAAFYDRVEVYRTAMQAQNTEVFEGALTQFVPSRKGYNLDTKALALHILSLDKILRDKKLHDLRECLKGRIVSDVTS